MRVSLGRRTILAQIAATAIIAGAPKPRRSAAEARLSRFVVILLRGALDGLAAVPPYGDQDYRTARGGLALRPPGAPGGIVDLDGFFGLHHSLASLRDFYARGQMLVMPAAATSYRQRLHGPGRTFLDSGGVGHVSTVESWFDRAAILLGGRGAGSETVLRTPGSSDDSIDLIANLCCNNPALGRLVVSGAAGAQIDSLLKGQASAFRQAAGEAGRSLSAPGGPRVAVLESFGWDTHSEQGTHEGRLAIALSGLADGLLALAAACGEAWRDTIVLVATEFGRSVHMNGMGGTDHGTASAAFLVGGAVAGGRVVGRWPGLAADRLDRGHGLSPTIDLHAIVRTVLVDHLGLSSNAVERIILPGRANLQARPSLLGT